MDLEKQPAPQATPPEGCLTVAIRIPVRIVVLVLVVPIAKAVGWLGKVLVVIPLVWLYRYVLTPVGQGIAWLARGIVAGLVWVYARVLTPVGHGIVWLLKGVGAVLAWIFTPVGRAIVWCARGIAWLAGAVVTGIGVALYWIARVLLVLPVVALWRWVLAPIGRVLAVIGREVWDALGHAWRIAGHISLAVGRFLGTLFRWIFVEPVRWVYRSVLTPVGHVVRDVVLRPVAEAARSVGRITRAALASARESVRQARADFRRMLFGDAGHVSRVSDGGGVGAVGETREREVVALREPTGADTRTLGSSTTALTKD